MLNNVKIDQEAEREMRYKRQVKHRFFTNLRYRDYLLQREIDEFREELGHNSFPFTDD